MNRLPNVHPGEVLREEFLVPLGMTPYQLARRIGVSQTRISEILHGKRAVTAETALLLGRCFHVTAQFWMNLQAAYDLEEAQERMQEQIAAVSAVTATNAGAAV